MNNDTFTKENHESYWLESTSIPAFPAVAENIEADIAVIGGGIAGITTAYLLTKQGYQVALIEAEKIGHGTTGYTTGKLTAQHDLIYDELINKHGMETARIHYQAATEAIEFVRTTEEELQKDFDLQEEPAYVFTQQEKHIKQIEKEYDAYQQIGIPGELTDKLPLDMSIKKAVVMHHQVRFHPMAYMEALTAYITAHGGSIYEHSRAASVTEGEYPAVTLTNEKTVSCKHLVIASHFPFNDLKGFYFNRLDIARSYTIAGKSPHPYPGGMYISIDSPSRSIRNTASKNGEELWLIGGEGHRPGKGDKMEEHYYNLKNFASVTFDMNEVDYYWSSQDLISLDKLFYIGQMTERSKNIFVATAFRKWGMSGGITAAKEITALITNHKSLYQEIYAPSRPDAAKGIGELSKNAFEVAKELIGGKLQKSEDIEKLNPGEAGKVREKGKLVGVYKDESGTIHKVDTTCTHMKCEVNWNDAEKTWDCPCHGSRFQATGDVIEGPAVKPLKRID